MKSAIIIFALFTVWSAASLSGQEDKELLENAKLQIFDKNWSDALQQLEMGLRQFPDSSLRDAFLFYRAKCLEELRQWKAALAAYNDYIRLSRNENLKEEAQSSRIDISYELYKQGELTYIQNIKEMLAHPQKVLRYYAAFKLSYCKEKSIAMASLPVLERILDEEKDSELKDKAKLAILRIAPERLSSRNPSADSGNSPLRFLVIEIKDQSMSKTASIRVPVALADLALKSLDANAKSRMKEKGYDVDQLLKRIAERKGTILEIRDNDEWIKIWIE